jgi:hypothetical protein
MRRFVMEPVLAAEMALNTSFERTTETWRRIRLNSTRRSDRSGCVDSVAFNDNLRGRPVRVHKISMAPLNNRDSIAVLGNSSLLIWVAVCSTEVGVFVSTATFLDPNAGLICEQILSPFRLDGLLIRKQEQAAWLPPPWKCAFGRPYSIAAAAAVAKSTKDLNIPFAVKKLHLSNTDRPSVSRLYSVLIPLLPCLCLVILSIGVWKHVKRSEQPPLWDAINYMQKAKAFWDMVASGQWKNPLNLEPVFRPPGTILMSYPLGFSADYKGFLARSVILPVFLFITALYVAASRRQMSRAEHLDLAAVALILASLPCFYHFEAFVGVNSPTYWGLVDSFLAAVAALAFATGYRAVQSSSWPLLALASFLSGLCMMIKPAGVIVAPVIVTLLIIIKIFNDLSRPGGRLFSIQLFSFVITASAGTGLMLIAALQSLIFRAKV